MKARILCMFLAFILFACDSEQQEQAKPKITVPKPLSADEQPYVWIYIDDGALQCEKPGRPLSETERLLSKSNIKSELSRCGTITGSMTMTLCGTRDLNIHLLQIARTQLKKAQALGFQSVENIGHGGSKSYKFTDCPTP